MGGWLVRVAFLTACDSRQFGRERRSDGRVAKTHDLRLHVVDLLQHFLQLFLRKKTKRGQGKKQTPFNPPATKSASDLTQPQNLTSWLKSSVRNEIVEWEMLGRVVQSPVRQIRH